MNPQITPVNTPSRVATRFAKSRFVSRTDYFSIAQGVTRALSSIDTPEQVATGSREYHQAAAIKAADKVAHQFTAQAKKQAKRECLGHLIASLARPGAGKKAGKA